MTTFTLVEREKLGPNAYRQTTVEPQYLVGDADERYAVFADMAKAPCYGPHGTHTLVLLAVTR